MTSNTRRAFLQVGIGSLGLSALPTWAQTDWPSRAIVVIVPFPAGGGTDAFARPISAVMSKSLGKQVVIDSRGGAGGNLGATLAARATGISGKEAMGIGILMNARGLMELIIINIGLQRGIISEGLFATLVIMAVVTTLMASPLFELLVGRHRPTATLA